MMYATLDLVFLEARSRSVSFAGAQGIPKYICPILMYQQHLHQYMYFSLLRPGLELSSVTASPHGLGSW